MLVWSRQLLQAAETAMSPKSLERTMERRGVVDKPSPVKLISVPDMVYLTFKDVPSVKISATTVAGADWSMQQLVDSDLDYARRFPIDWC